MNAAVIREVFRGVVCQHCGKPVRLSASLLRRETTIKEEDDASLELCSRVFPARCHACYEEAIYAMDQVANFLEGD